MKKIFNNHVSRLISYMHRDNHVIAIEKTNCSVSCFVLMCLNSQIICPITSEFVEVSIIWDIDVWEEYFAVLTSGVDDKKE